MAEDRRRLLIVRHGERCDYHFKKRGIKWLEAAFDSQGNYRRFDPQTPASVPSRRDGFKNYYDDTPITQLGYEYSVKTGRQMRSRGMNVDVVYASPSFRCVQTAQGIVEGLANEDLRIRVEPGLFQWTRWCKHGVLPHWIPVEELRANGIPVDTEYSPIEGDAHFDLSETLTDYYNRSFALMTNVLKRHPKGTILLVAHAGSLDTLVRQLCGGAPLDRESFSRILHKTSYLSVNEAAERANGSWKMIGSPFQSLFTSGLDRC